MFGRTKKKCGADKRRFDRLRYRDRVRKEAKHNDDLLKNRQNK